MCCDEFSLWIESMKDQRGRFQKLTVGILIS